MARKSKKNKPAGRAELPVMRPDAAGIDVGSTSVHVAVPGDRDPEPVRTFEVFTPDLHTLADWLVKCGVKTVAMESTSVYWIPLFQILEARDIDVCLVNARHVKNVPGRKTDVSDCQWLQYLHSVGLLRASFRPEQAVCAVRTLLRHRESLVQMAGTHVHHMQKALDQMNLQIHHVISDITGVTGLAILDAVLEGERDPDKLAKLRNQRIKASGETIAKSLVGDYRVELLFTLRQSLKGYRACEAMIADCDAETHRMLVEIESKNEPPPTPEPGVVPDKAAPDRPFNLTSEWERIPGVDLTKVPDKAAPDRPFNLTAELERILGVDLTKVPGLGPLNVQVIVGEVSGDLSKFRSAAAFASWLGLCPANDVSGGRVLKTGTRKVNNRAAKALRLAAQTLYRSKTPLGDFYRRMRAKLGGPKAVTAAAHKLARLIYRLVTTGKAYDESTFAKQQERYRKNQEAKLASKARELGYELVRLVELELIPG